MTENLSDMYIPVLDLKVQQVKIAFLETTSSISLISNITEDSRSLSLWLQVLQYPEQLP